MTVRNKGCADLILKRIARKSTYTIGKLYLNNVYFCDTIEDTDRGLTNKMSLDEINKIKVKDKTAIPTGTYLIDLNTISPRFKNNPKYAFIKGKLPRLINVPGFVGVLIHIGNTASDSSGCIIVGENKEVGKVINSTKTFQRLMAELNKYANATLTII